MQDEFRIHHFLPYLMNQAADALSVEFQKHYRETYGMLRTEWRVLFHLGSYGEMTATEVCTRAKLHKTKVSRAVAALEAKRYLVRVEQTEDRRHSTLSLTRKGLKVFAELRAAAQDYDAKARARLAPEEAEVLHQCLLKIAGMEEER